MNTGVLPLKVTRNNLLISLAVSTVWMWSEFHTIFLSCGQRGFIGFDIKVKKSLFFCFSVLPSHTCGTPGVIPNGVIHGSRYSMGDKIRYSCESGFVLEGHSILTCIVSPGSGAQWDFPSPFCRGKMASVSFLIVGVMRIEGPQHEVMAQRRMRIPGMNLMDPQILVQRRSFRTLVYEHVQMNEQWIHFHGMHIFVFNSVNWFSKGW